MDKIALGFKANSYYLITTGHTADKNRIFIIKTVISAIYVYAEFEGIC